MVCGVTTQTATVRVTRKTRDLLAEQARERGVSVSTMLADIAQDAEREAIFRSERMAAIADASNPAVAEEERDWEAAIGDGID